MKARVKSTGEVVEIKYTIKHISNGKLYKCLAVNGKEYMAKEVELIPDEPDYWEKLKHQYAGMAMQAYINNNVYMREIREMCKTTNKMRELVADLSVLLATALVEKLKNE